MREGGLIQSEALKRAEAEKDKAVDTFFDAGAAIKKAEKEDQCPWQKKEQQKITKKYQETKTTIMFSDHTTFNKNLPLQH